MTGGDSHTRAGLLLLAGPVLWFGHFLAVYVLVESGCAAGGTDVELLGLDVMALVTIVATVVAAAVCLGAGLVASRRWRGSGDGVLAGGEKESGMALAAMLLGSFFVLAILFTGFPALYLDPC